MNFRCIAGIAFVSSSTFSHALILDDFSSATSTISLDGSNQIDSNLESVTNFTGSRGIFGILAEGASSTISTDTGELVLSNFEPGTAFSAQTNMSLYYGATSLVGNSFGFSSGTNFNFIGTTKFRLKYSSTSSFLVRARFFSDAATPEVIYSLAATPGSGIFEFQTLVGDNPGTPDWANIDMLRIDIAGFPTPQFSGIPDVLTIDDIELVGAVPEPVTVALLAVASAAILRRKRS